MTAAAAADSTAARVIECFGRRVIVETPAGEHFAAELFGKRLTVVCGDEVQIRNARDVNTTDDSPRVISVSPRRSLFSRTDSRGRTEHLAANLTLLAVVIAPEPYPDAFMIDRYLAGAAYAGIRGTVIVNKCDLPAADDEQFLALVEDYKRAGYPVIQVSAKRGIALETLRSLLQSQVTMLAGQSGVGKSTFTNALIPTSQRRTRALSESRGGEGRHTTVSTALLKIPEVGELIDSPGVRDYAPALIEDALVQIGWPEILSLAPECKFNNCLHLREPACAVVKAVEARTLSSRRYESYKRLMSIMRGLAPDYERRR
jgi:ribosome biogenesis GTPase